MRTPTPTATASASATTPRSQHTGRGTDVREPDASDEEEDDDLPDFVDLSESDDDDIDSDSDMTDDGVEGEVAHESETISWGPSKAWAELRRKKRLSDLELSMGEAQWEAPANRDAVRSLDSGPEQDIYFHADAARTAIDLFLEALPLNTFWKPLAKNSLAYARIARADSTKTMRYLNEKWFTPSNYMRVFAAVIMKGLVNAKDDPEFFAGMSRGNFSRTGAAEVVGLTINQYQQLLRYMHIVDNGKQKGPTHADFDKCFKVRPVISLLQKVFLRWASPGKNNAMDEAGIPSRHRWMRTFNPSKPQKYFMEILMGCDSRTRYCWHFFVTESAKKTILNRHRRSTGDGAGTRRQRSKFIQVRIIPTSYTYHTLDIDHFTHHRCLTTSLSTDRANGNCRTSLDLQQPR